MNEYAVIHDVRQVIAGSYVVSVSGAVVTVQDAADFAVSGGTVVIDGSEVTYASADHEASTLTLSSAQSLAEGTFVQAVPYVVFKEAVVVLDEASDGVSVRVPHALFDRLPEGIRDPAERENVVIGTEGTDLVVLDVLGKEAVIDGAYLDTGSVGIDALGPDVTARELGGSKVYRQASMPSDGREGDTWYDTDDGNKVYVHNGTTFVLVQDAGIGANEQAVQEAANAAAQAAAAAAIAKDIADAATGLASVGKVFVQGSAPVREVLAENRVADPLMQTAGYWFSSSQTNFPRTVVTTSDGKTASRITRNTASGATALYSARAAGYEAPITAAVGGETITVVFNVMSNVDMTLISQLGYGTGTASLSAVSEDVALVANVPRTIRRVITVPATGAHIGQQLYLKFYLATGNIGDWFQIWEPGWFTGNYDGGYFDATTPDTDAFVYGWAGTPNNSFSRRFANTGLWIDTTGGNNTPKRFNGDSWEAVTDAAAIAAQNAAQAAQDTADTINNSTLPAFSQYIQGQIGGVGQAAADASALAGNKNSNFSQSTTPTALKAGDTWIDTGNGNILKVATAPGTANWVSRQDVMVAAAKAAAETAQASADGKNKVTYSTTAPVNGTSVGAVGDTWFVRNTSTGVVSAHYECTAANTWTLKTLATSVIANLDAGKITTGTLSADRIAANALSIGKVNGLQSALDSKATPAQVDAAKQQAITDATAAAATDAQTKANQAKADAEAAAKTYADTVASGAEADAIAAAATDAQAKADAAQAAAQAAAAADATAKANQAKTDALNAAIADASQKYDYAKARVADWTYPNSTEINGAYLRTGTVAANQIIVGNGNTTPLSTEVASKATPADVSTAKTEAISTAQGYADTTYGGTKSLVDGWRVTGQTTINGGVIQTDTIGAGQIAAGAITAKHTITGATLQTSATASRGVKITSSGLFAYNGSGTATLSINGSTGAISMLGALTSGSSVTGATVTGGVIQSEATANRGVKITSSGLTAYDSAGAATLAITGSTGAVTMKGALTSGSTVSGATVTGGVIQTETTTARGIKIDTSGLTAYDASGNPTLSINAADGTIGMKGSLTSGSIVSGAQVNGSTITGGVVQTGSDNVGTVRLSSTGDNGFTAYREDGQIGVRIPRTGLFQGSLVVDWGGLILNSANNFINNGGTLWALGQAAADPGTYTSLSGGVLKTGTWSGGSGFNTTYPEIVTSPTEIRFRSSATNGGQAGYSSNTNSAYLDSLQNVFIRAQNGSAEVNSTSGLARVIGVNATLTSNSTTTVFSGDTINIQSNNSSGGASAIVLTAPNGGGIIIGSTTTGGNVVSPRINANTTSSPANVVIGGSSGTLSRSTSSRRYKTDIQVKNIDPEKVLSIVPSSWLDKAEIARYEEDPDNNPVPKRYVGVIAEQLDEIGLHQFVGYNEEGQPDSVYYDRLFVASLPLLKLQQDRIASLEASHASLEQRLAALEAA